MTISRDRIYEGFEATCDTPACCEWSAFHVTTASDMEKRLEEVGWSTPDGFLFYCKRCTERRTPVARLDGPDGPGGYASAAGSLEDSGGAVTFDGESLVTGTTDVL